MLTYVSGHASFSEYLELQKMPQVAELTIFCGAMVGASIGFLWYNAHPAEIFMGDVGSLALGGAPGWGPDGFAQASVRVSRTSGIEGILFLSRWSLHGLFTRRRDQRGKHG